MPKFALLWLISALISFASLVGCSDDEAGGASTEILSEGSGEANTEPLEPLSVGTRRAPFFGVFDALVEHDGKQFYRYQVARDLWVPELHSTFLHNGKDGVELWFSSQDGWLENPIMFVPKVARVGKRWRAKLGDTVLYEYEVVSRTTEPTAHGEQTIWTITQKNLTDDFVTTRRYIEGIGLTSLEGSLSFAHTHFAIPLESQTETRPTVSADVPVPVAIDSERLGNLSTTSVSLVRPAGSDSALLIVKGWEGCAANDGRCEVDLCFKVDGTSATQEGEPGVLDTFHKGPSCTKQRLGQSYRMRFTSDATGALVTDDQVYWVPRDRFGSATDQGDQFPVAIYATPETREPRLLKQFNVFSSRYDSVSWQETYSTVFHGVNTDDQRPLFGNSTLLDSLTGVLASRLEDPKMVLSLAAPGDPVELAWIGSNNLLMHAKMVDDVLSTPVPVTTLTGQLSVTSDERGQHILLASPDGSIDRVVLSDGRLVPEAIGRVRLPEGETLVAALDLTGTKGGDGRLLVATYSLRTTNPIGLGSTRFYTTKLQTPVPFEFPPALGVVAADHGADVVVCWPETTEILETQGWSIAGVAAKEVMQISENCALVSRDVEADPTFGGRDLSTLPPNDALFALRYMPFYAEGPVPGVGRMRLGVEHSKIDYSNFISPMGGVFANLDGGGYATRDKLFTPGGVELGFTRHLERTPGGNVADRKGAGVWEVYLNGDIMLSSRESAFFERPETLGEEQPLRYFASPGGGLIINYGYGTSSFWFHLSSSGEWTALPDAPEGSQGFLAQRPNGDLCGVQNDTSIFCMDETGAISVNTAVTQDIVDQLGGAYFDMMVGLEDGSLLLQSSITPGVYRLAPGADSVEIWNEGQLLEPNFDVENRAYAVVVDELGERKGGYLSPNGFEPIDLGEWKQRYHRVHSFHGRLVGLFPGPDRLWVLSDGCFRGTCSTLASPILWP